MRQRKVVCIAFLWKSESTLLCKAVTKSSVLTFLSYEVSKGVEIKRRIREVGNGKREDRLKGSVIGFVGTNIWSIVSSLRNLLL